VVDRNPLLALISPTKSYLSSPVRSIFGVRVFTLMFGMDISVLDAFGRAHIPLTINS